MRRRHSFWVLMLILQIGCARHHKLQAVAAPSPAPYQQFVSQKIDWSTVRRVVVMPMANETAYVRASDEIRTNLAAEMQRAGFFEVVVATRDDPGARSRDIFSRGQFDELELLRVAREYDAQAILFGKITQYHPYSPPQVGLSLLMVCPGEGVAIASADGLWDAREDTTARQAQAYQKHQLSWKQSLIAAERPLESPDVYQRFVCQQIAASLHPPDTLTQGMFNPVPPGSMMPGGGVLPAGGITTSAETLIQTSAQLPLLKTKP